MEKELTFENYLENNQIEKVPNSTNEYLILNRDQFNTLIKGINSYNISGDFYANCRSALDEDNILQSVGISLSMRYKNSRGSSFKFSSIFDYYKEEFTELLEDTSHIKKYSEEQILGISIDERDLLPDVVKSKLGYYSNSTEFPTLVISEEDFEKENIGMFQYNFFIFELTFKY